MLNDILDKCKPMEIKRDLSYINKTKTPTSGDTIFVKGKEETPNQLAFPSTTPNTLIVRSLDTLK